MSTESCNEFTLFYTHHGVIFAHRARFVASLRQDDDVLERKRVCVRLGPLLDACAIARHPERRDSMDDIQRLKIPSHAGISARFTYSTAIPAVFPGFTRSESLHQNICFFISSSRTRRPGRPGTALVLYQCTTVRGILYEQTSLLKG